MFLFFHTAKYVKLHKQKILVILHPLETHFLNLCLFEKNKNIPSSDKKFVKFLQTKFLNKN
jgi:hypothetical protein